MVINIRLSDRTAADRDDPLGRLWYGYDPTVSAEELWENNRGDWSLAFGRITTERWAALYYRGDVVLVAELDHTRHEKLKTVHGRHKTAPAGSVLPESHPMHEFLVATPVRLPGRNSVMYSPDPVLARADGSEIQGESDLPGRSGQGVQMNAQIRKAIEDAAQDRLMTLYSERGWTVTDTRSSRPYDAEAVKGNERLYLEAKGTQSKGESVIVTRNEVAHARLYAGQCRMGIWSGIRLEPDGTVDPRSGTFDEVAFEPEDQDLVPRDFDWKLR